jgi:RNA polymerase sigma-70 factor (ECF subfamily)
MDASDEELMQQYAAGMTDALGVLLERYRRPLYSFILRMVDVPTDADEVFQDVWLRVIRKSADYRSDRFRGWVFRIAHNLLIDRARRRRPDFSLDQTVATEGSDLTLGDRIAAPGLTPDATVEGHDLGTRIRDALMQLPVEQRQVFLLRTQGELPFKHIARIQRVSINTALARMQYALTKLRTLLQGDYETWRTP